MADSKTNLGTGGRGEDRKQTPDETFEPVPRGAGPILSVAFFRTETGNEPVRGWLKSLPRAQRKIIGEDIKTVQFGWPLGMPLVRKLHPDLWEVRIRLPDAIARVLFTIGERRMILLHGFIKKSQKTPQADLALAKTRRRLLQ